MKQEFRYANPESPAFRRGEASIDDEKYGLVLVLTCVFLVTATLMNRFAESYGN